MKGKNPKNNNVTVTLDLKFLRAMFLIMYISNTAS